MKQILSICIIFIFTGMGITKTSRKDYPNRDQALQLLNSDGVKGTWSLPESADEEDITRRMPQVRLGRDCIRDTYVGAAIMSAWAAESYNHLSLPEKAEIASEKMMTNLKEADQLCGNGVPNEDSRAGCQTFEIYPCK